mmetsp:Transcript_44423/g.95382  ORF Transcript_44423/g.95382 Transcript_44423/m.95382 type:complete len:385 (-) Transcript_44423:439-1593(-)
MPPPMFVGMLAASHRSRNRGALAVILGSVCATLQGGQTTSFLGLACRLDVRGVGLGGRVLSFISTHFLEFVAKTKEADQPQRNQDDDGEDADPQDDHQDGKPLSPGSVSTVEGAVAAHAVVGVAEEASGDNTPEAADTVDREGIHNIVNLGLLQSEGGTQVEAATDEADEDSLPGLDNSAGAGDGHEAGQDAVAEGADIQGLRGHDEDLDQEDGESGNAGGDGGVDSDDAGGVGSTFVVHGEGAARVEAIPSEPEAESAEDDEGDVVGIEFCLTGRVEAVLTGANDDCADHSTDATDHVHDTAAGEVDVASSANNGATLTAVLGVVEETLTRPGPVDDNRVDERGHQGCVDSEALEGSSLSHGATDDGGGSGAESALEEPDPEV